MLFDQSSHQILKSFGQLFFFQPFSSEWNSKIKAKDKWLVPQARAQVEPIRVERNMFEDRLFKTYSECCSC